MSSYNLHEAWWNCRCGFNYSFCHILWHFCFISGLFLLRRGFKYCSSPSSPCCSRKSSLLTRCASGQDFGDETSWLVARGEETSNWDFLLEDVWTTLCSPTKQLRTFWRRVTFKTTCQNDNYMDYNSRTTFPVFPPFDDASSNWQQTLTSMKKM